MFRNHEPKTVLPWRHTLPLLEFPVKMRGRMKPVFSGNAFDRLAEIGKRGFRVGNPYAKLVEVHRAPREHLHYELELFNVHVYFLRQHVGGKRFTEMTVNIFNGFPRTFHVEWRISLLSGHWSAGGQPIRATHRNGQVLFHDDLIDHFVDVLNKGGPKDKKYKDGEDLVPQNDLLRRNRFPAMIVYKFDDFSGAFKIVG